MKKYRLKEEAFEYITTEYADFILSELEWKKEYGITIFALIEAEERTVEFRLWELGFENGKNVYNRHYLKEELDKLANEWAIGIGQAHNLDLTEWLKEKRN